MIYPTKIYLLKENMPNNLATSISRPMILAPAGGREQFLTAINAGADAIYLGLKDFNARGRAENFSIKELKSLMPLARSKNVKILVTLNIVLKETEIPQITEILCELEWLGIHAVILQDIGLARFIRNKFPALRMHASTQLAIHNLEGVLVAAQMGFQQVVLARELTAREIANIRKKTPPEIALEVFCHGSLCYSYSGLCFFSGAEDARSGNRGECAYTCRKPYKILNEPGHGFLFSMKDLNTTTDLNALVDAGVNTLKIEGRMKDSQYVASSVGLYKNQLDKIFGITSNTNRDFEHDGQFGFQREMTSLFLRSRYDENVIDLNNPTHKGVLVGVIETVYGKCIKLKTAEALELHDGLKIDKTDLVYHSKPQHGVSLESQPLQAQNKYKNDNFQFPILKMELNNRSVTSVAAGNSIAIILPDNAPMIKSGDRVYKVRSNDLKRYTDSLQHIPERLRELDFIQLKIDLKINPIKQLVIAITAIHGNDEIYKTTLIEPAEKPVKESHLPEDITDIFTILGDFQIECQVQITGDSNWFIHKSRLKSIKKDLGTTLRQLIDNYRSTKNKNLSNMISITTKNPVDTLNYVIKFDRLEFLSILEHHLQSDKALPINEIIFEPKKAFLPKENPAEVLQQIKQFAENHHLVFRLAIPLVIREWDLIETKKWLTAYSSCGNMHYEIGNLGGLELLNSLGIDIHSIDISADFTLYALNHLAVEELSDLNFSSATISIEDDLHNLRPLLNKWNGPEPRMIIFKDTPLFIAEACTLTALHNGCPTGKVCGYRTLHIEDEKGERYFVAHESCKSIVYGERAFSIVHEQDTIKSLGIKTARLDFLTRQYSEEAIFNIFDQTKNNLKISNTHTANFRGKLL